MLISDFQRKAAETDQIPWTELNGSDVPLLGIIGEFGSVAATLKKRLRDEDAYTGFENDLIEELGDLLWYVAITASRLGIELDEVSSQGADTDVFNSIYRLSGNVTRLLLERDTLIEATSLPAPESVEVVNAIVTDLHAIAVSNGHTIHEIAEDNIRKVNAFWKEDTTLPAKNFDADYPHYERFPRQMTLNFLAADDGNSLIVQLNGVNVGDRLTDNAYQDDGYRFHDIFHFSNVALLGWSPVIRRMLGRKRKSNPKVDEVEDGARAAIVEELVVNRIYDYARDHDFLSSTRKIDIGLIKSISSLVRDLEVKVCEPWEWKHCILEGCRVFRELRKRQTGSVVIDSDKRQIYLQSKQ